MGNKKEQGAVVQITEESMEQGEVAEKREKRQERED